MPDDAHRDDLSADRYQILRDSGRKAARGLLETATVLYLLIRHPGAMGTVIVISAFLLLGLLALIIDSLAVLILGYEIIGSR